MFTALQIDILESIAYFDIFRYPLTEEEIYLFLGSLVRRSDLQMELAALCAGRHIYCIGGFYSLQNSPALIDRRLSGNKRAAEVLKKANRICRFLYNFPFVRGVAISGSLSKDFFDETSDIDYFIITSSDRLWISRTLLHCYKKLTFLTRRQHNYCMNYFIDEAALEIEEKNTFTATELMTLKPICGNGTIDAFFKANRWASRHFPNQVLAKKSIFENPSRPRWQRFFESLFNNRLGNRLENYLMNLTTRRWEDKELNHKLNSGGGRVGLRTGKHFSKPNPVFFQHKILSMHAGKMSDIKKSFTLSVQG